jgi:uncharacterized protein YbjT (DUF2867 family)
MIFLTGATGHVGLHVARALERRLDVRALAHSDRSAAILDDLGIDVVRGDLRDPEPLADAFAGVERLLLISPPAPGHGEMELAALELAERAGVLEHVVKLSSIGVQGTEPALLSQPHVMVEQRLGRGSYTSTLLRPASFMTNVMNNVTEIRDGKLLMPAGDARIPFIDPRDVADVAVLTLTAPEKAKGPLVMTGPEALSFADLAAKLSAALGREIAYIDVEEEAWQAYRIEAGVPPPLVEAIASLYQSLRQDREWPIADTQERLLDRAPYTFDQWLVAEGRQMLETAWNDSA